MQNMTRLGAKILLLVPSSVDPESTTAIINVTRDQVQRCNVSTHDTNWCTI